MADVTLVIVNYFSAALAQEAVSSAKRTTTMPLRVIVVDNSCDASEAKRLEDAGADEVIIAPDNEGYSGGANRGVARSTSNVVIVSNPDVVFDAGCLDELASTVGSEVAVAGPLMHWDLNGAWLLPPADYLDVRECMSRLLASRFASRERNRASSRLRRRIRFWRRQKTARVDVVAGAVLAFDRGWFDTVGGFDTRYALYFEEIDLIRRLGARGGRAAYVPEARCRHLYNQSAGRDAASLTKYAASESMYLKRWAPMAGGLMKRFEMARSKDETGFRTLDPTDAIPLPAGDREWLVEASSMASFEAAAGRFASGEAVALPEEIWASYRSPVLYLRVCDPESLAEIGRYAMRKA